VERFVRRFKHWIGVAILLIASVVFVIWDHPTGLVVFWFAFVVLIAFAIREFLAPGPASPNCASRSRPAPARRTARWMLRRAVRMSHRPHQAGDERAGGWVGRCGAGSRGGPESG
jgi:hypothetical protein